MNTREIKREANLLYKTVQPLLGMGGNFESLILADTSKVMQICGRNSNELTSNQLLAFFVFYALVKNDTDKLNFAINSWEFVADTRRTYEKEAVKMLLDWTKTQSRDDRFVLPSVLNQLDEEKGSNYLDKVVNAMYRFAQVIVKADGQISIEDMEVLSVIWRLLHTYNSSERFTPSSGVSSPAFAPSSGLDAVLNELNQLIGMENIKREVQTLTNFLKVQQVRSQRGLAKTPVSLHSVFSGPPGTGKTTVARLMGRIFKELGFLEAGTLVETDRAGMVAAYIGGTSEKVNKLVESALDGLLFVDEAYALNTESGQDFGKEAIDVLLKRMEDYRNRLVVIVAGYTDEMADFVESNPGLKSRFNRYFYFNDYSPEELVAIFNKLCKDSHFKPTQAANQKLLDLFTQLYYNRDRTFGNARLARNLFEKTIEQQANRLAVISSLTDEVLTTILPEDIPAIAAIMPREIMASSSPVAHSDPTPSPLPPTNLDRVSSVFNEILHSQGITTKASLKDGCLQLLFVADPVPDAQSMLTLTHDVLSQVETAAIAQVRLYGKQPSDEFPAWTREFEI